LLKLNYLKIQLRYFLNYFEMLRNTFHEFKQSEITRNDILNIQFFYTSTLILLF